MMPFLFRRGTVNLILGTLLVTMPCAAFAENGDVSEEATLVVDSQPETSLPEVKLDLNEEIRIVPSSPTLLRGSLLKTDEYPIDLETVLKLAADQNLQIAQDQLETRVVKNTFYQNLSNLLPSIYATYDHSRFQGGIQIFGNETLTIYQTRIQPQLLTRWTLYPGGTTLFESLAARRRYNASESFLQETYQEQLARAVDAYFQLIATYVQRDDARQSLQEASYQVSVSEARIRAGVGTNLELMRAQNLQAQRERNLIQAENSMLQREQELLNRLNLDRHIHLIPKTIEAVQLVLVPPSTPPELLIQEALVSNPELEGVNAEIKALQADHYAAISAIVPSVTLEANIGGTGPYIDDLFLTRQGRFRIEANLLENLGTEVLLNIRRTSLLIKQAKLRRDQVIRDIETNVTNAWLDSSALAKEIQVAEVELATAQEAYRLAVARFEAGVGIQLDVLDAETELSNARFRLADAVVRFDQAQIRLLEAMGKISIPNIMQGQRIPAVQLTPPTQQEEEQDDNDEANPI